MPPWRAAHTTATVPPAPVQEVKARPQAPSQPPPENLLRVRDAVYKVADDSEPVRNGQEWPGKDKKRKSTASSSTDPKISKTDVQDEGQHGAAEEATVKYIVPPQQRWSTFRENTLARMAELETMVILQNQVIEDLVKSWDDWKVALEARINAN